MTCGEAKRLMHKALAGDASAEERERLADHAENCERCAAEWHTITGAVDALQAARPEQRPTDRDLSAGVIARIAREANGPAQWASRVAEVLASRPVQAAGAVAATAICALILWLATPAPQALAALLNAGPRVGY